MIGSNMKSLRIWMAPLLLAVALGLYACAPPAAPAAPESAAEPMAAEPMAEGDVTLTIGMNELVTSLDPPTDWAIAATWIHMNMFDCLIWRNRETADFEPWLAESYDHSC